MTFMMKNHIDGHFCEGAHGRDGHGHGLKLKKTLYCKKSTILSNINFPFGDNTAIPQARPKENLWDILSQKAYEGGWKATMQQELISQIQSQLKNVDSNFLQSLYGRDKDKIACKS
jgi:hypothetical protein